MINCWLEYIYRWS